MYHIPYHLSNWWCDREVGDSDGNSNKATNLRLLSTFLNEIDGIGARGASSSRSKGKADGAAEVVGVLVIVACMDLDKVYIRSLYTN